MKRVYDEVIAGGNLDLLDEVIHDDFIEHEAMPGIPSDKTAPKAFMTMLRAGFPDVCMSPEHMVEEGDTVVVRGRMTGTHEGEFMGTRDGMAMMEQLGVVPTVRPARRANRGR